MSSAPLTISLEVNHTPLKVFKAINDVAGWWTKTEGRTSETGDTFTVRFGDVFITLQVSELIPNKKVMWQVTDSSEKEWVNTRICFDISVTGNLTQLDFTHMGMQQGMNDYEDSLKGWTRFITVNLPAHIEATPVSMEEIITRYSELALAERWFDIQHDLFAPNVKSIDPAGSPYLGYAEGKAAVRKKGEDFVAGILDFHGAHTTLPVSGGAGASYFAVGRSMEITTKAHGRINLEQVMLYQVKDGEIVSEQFFY